MKKPEKMIIYNLFPLLAGKFTDWERHLLRASEMGFNWVFINPIQRPGESGSLYSIADYYDFNPVLVDPKSKKGPQEQAKEAINVLEGMEKSNPYFSERKLDLASAYAEKGEPDKASSLLKDVAAKDPNNDRIKEVETHIKIKSGNLVGALEVMDGMQDVGPEFAARLNLMAIDLAKSGKGQEALDLYSKAHKIVIDELKYKVGVAANRVKQQQAILDEQIKRQNELKQKVSSKSDDIVDIKPGQTVEDIYVSLRRRGKVLKGQGSKEAPILEADQKVLLLPERSIRILKEFLVDLKDQDNKTLLETKQENELLKETANHFFTKIKEQHERDKVVGAPSENEAKNQLAKYEDLVSKYLPINAEIDRKVNEISKLFGKNLDRNCELGKEQYVLFRKYAELSRELNRLRQIASDLNELQEGAKQIGEERIRKKERTLEMQKQNIDELNKHIQEITALNEKLRAEYQAKEDALREFDEK